jgi:hypothetical protein
MREAEERARRVGRRCAVGALVLVFAVVATALAAPSGPAPPVGDAALESAAPPGAASPTDAHSLVAFRLSIEEQATVASRPGGTQPPGVAYALGGSLQRTCPDRGAVAIGARAKRGSGIDAIERWCLAHATATQAP